MSGANLQQLVTIADYWKKESSKERFCCSSISSTASPNVDVDFFLKVTLSSARKQTMMMTVKIRGLSIDCMARTPIGLPSTSTMAWFVLLKNWSTTRLPISYKYWRRTAVPSLSTSQPIWWSTCGSGSCFPAFDPASVRGSRYLRMCPRAKWSPSWALPHRRADQRVTWSMI